MLSGLSMGVAGMITASQLNSAKANINPDIVFDVITIVVGGTSLGGGIGSMWRTAVGLGIIATISNAFSLAAITPDYQDIVNGCIVVGALASTCTRAPGRSCPHGSTRGSRCSESGRSKWRPGSRELNRK